MGTTVFRIRIELIFRRCWNLITPSRSLRPMRACRKWCQLSTSVWISILGVALEASPRRTPGG